MTNYQKGKEGENIAVNFLLNNGIKIIEKNFFTKFGEIDLIGIEKDTIIFIEVKFRKNNLYGSALESISKGKLRRVYKSAEIYLQEKDLHEADCRFDVVCIDEVDGYYRINWLKNENIY